MEKTFDPYPEKEYHEDMSKYTEELIELRDFCKNKMI